MSETTREKKLEAVRAAADQTWRAVRALGKAQEEAERAGLWWLANDLRDRTGELARQAFTLREILHAAGQSWEGESVPA